MTWGLKSKHRKIYLLLTGNIAIHLFLQETRELYDLESLWALGPEFDEQSQAKPDDADEIFYGLLSDLKPAQTKEQPSEDLKPSKTKETGVAKRWFGKKTKI